MMTHVTPPSYVLRVDHSPEIDAAYIVRASSVSNVGGREQFGLQ